MAGVLWN